MMEDTGTDTIEHLDFEYAPPCEHNHHRPRHADEAAKYVVHVLCPGCRREWTYLLCASGWRDLMSMEAAGCDCGHVCHASEAMEIVEVLR